MFAFSSWQGTAGSQRLELTLANVGTTGYHCYCCCCCMGYHCKQLPVTRGWSSCFLTWEPYIGYHCKELPAPKGWNWWFPTWEPKVTMARNCRFPDLETYGSQPGNQRLPLQGIAGSQKLEFMFSKLSNYHCKELPVVKAWNSWFQTWKSIRYQWKDLLIPKR